MILLTSAKDHVKILSNRPLIVDGTNEKI